MNSFRIKVVVISALPHPPIQLHISPAGFIFIHMLLTSGILRGYLCIIAWFLPLGCKLREGRGFI